MTTQSEDYKTEDRVEKVTVQQNGPLEHKERIVEDRGTERMLVTDRISRFVILVFSLIEILVGIRVLLKLIAANPSNVFANLVYEASNLFVKPFATLIANPTSGGMVLEITSVIAMLVYALIAWVLVQLVRLVLYKTRQRSVAVVNKDRQL